MGEGLVESESPSKGFFITPSPQATKERLPSKSILRTTTKDFVVSYGSERAIRGTKDSTAPAYSSERAGRGSKDSVGSQTSELREAGRVRFDDIPPSPISEAGVNLNADLTRNSLPGAVDTTDTSLGGEDNNTCTICLEAAVQVEFLPCSHKLACSACASKLGVSCP